MEKKTIYLKAYLSKNLGDDMFVHCIAERYPEVLFKIYTISEYAQAFHKQTNIKNRSNMLAFLDRVSNKLTGKQICRQYIEKTADATVHIGGSIFIEPEGFVPPKAYYSNPKLYVIGCNFGPYKTDAYYRFIFSRLQKATDVCFRDRYSYEKFAALGHARMAPDVLFGYPNYPTPKTGCGIGISVINPSMRPDLQHIADTYYRVIAQLVDRYADMGKPVKLFSFCTAEGDLAAITEILKRCKTDTADSIEYNGDIDVMLDKINSCEYIVASRFHAMIIGWCLSKKVFPIIYSDKQSNVIDDVGYSGPCWDLRNPESYTAEKLLGNIFASNAQSTETYKVDAQRQFEKLDSYLK